MAKSAGFAHPGFSIPVESQALIRGALRDLRKSFQLNSETRPLRGARHE